MSSTTNRILSIYNSRKTILSFLQNQMYNVEQHMGFSINEVDAMVQNDQLDMLLESTVDARKVYVKYLCGKKTTVKQASPKIFREIVDDLFLQSMMLTRDDTLILIMDGEPNEPMTALVKYLYDSQGYFVVVHNLARLQYNVLEHQYVPPTRILSAEETRDVLRKYNVHDARKQLPEISRFDPVALAICMRPGQVCEIKRSSPTASESMFYRVCV